MYRVQPYETTHYPLFVRGMLKLHRKLYRDPIRRYILTSFLKHTRPSPSPEPGLPFSVHTLICSRDLHMGVCAAKSLNLACGRALPWVFHDDGSLKPEDIRFLLVHFPGVRVITRQEADAALANQLASFPILKRWREKQFYMVKIPDVKHFSSGKKILFMDTDVLFFRKPDWLLERLYQEGSVANSFNKDISTHYSLDTDSINRIIGQNMVDKINVGLWIMNNSDIDLMLVEEWLRAVPADLPALKARLMEQTLLAMLATVSKNGVQYLPPSYDVGFEKAVEQSVCKHYVGRIRHGFELEGLRYLTRELGFIESWRNFAGSHS